MIVHDWWARLPGVWRKAVLALSMTWFGVLLLLWWLGSRDGSLGAGGGEDE